MGKLKETGICYQPVLYRTDQQEGYEELARYESIKHDPGHSVAANSADSQPRLALPMQDSQTRYVTGRPPLSPYPLVKAPNYGV